MSSSALGAMWRLKPTDHRIYAYIHVYIHVYMYTKSSEKERDGFLYLNLTVNRLG